MALGRWWRQRRDARILDERPIPDALWSQTLTSFPLLQWLTREDAAELRRLSTLFLAEKEFHGAHGFEVRDDMAVAIAAQACLPVIHLGLSSYASFVGIVVHEAQVHVRRQHVDDSGVVTLYDDVLSGEAMEGGPVMLSWEDVSATRAGGQDTAYNVVIHEFMHVLDLGDGELNGMPALRGGPAHRQHWKRVTEASLARLRRAVDAGRQTLIDPYGAEGLEEFFAVAAEAFFTSPMALGLDEPALYALFADHFQQDPARHWRAPA